MKSSIFSVDNVVFQAISRVGDMFIMSLLFLFTSLPVFTIGASLTALNDITIKILRQRDSGIFRGYFKSFKSNFYQATIIWLIMLPIGAALFFMLYCTANYCEDKTVQLILGGLIIGACLIYAFTLVFVFGVQAVFNNTIKATIRTAFYMSIRNIGSSLLIVVSLVAISVVCWYLPIVSFFFLIFGVGLFALIFNTRILTVFRKYNNELMPDVVEGKPEPVLQKLPSHKDKEKRKQALATDSKGKKIIR